MDGRGIKDLHKCGEEMSKNSSLPSQEQQETSELNGSGGGRGKGIRGPRPFVPVGDTNRDKRGAFYPGWWLQSWQKTARAFCPGWSHQPGLFIVPVGVSNRNETPWPPDPLSSPPARAIQLICSCCFWLGRGEFLLISSPHL